jgi:cytochrome P450
MLNFPFPAGALGTAPVEFAQLRASTPVARVRLADGTEISLVTRYADVVTVLTDERFSRQAAAALAGSGFGRSQRTGLLDLDPPAHAALREPLDRALRKEQVHSWLPALDKAVREQVAELAGSAQPADLVADFARPLAGRVTCELVGLGAAAWPAVADQIDRMLSADSSAAEVAGARTELAAVLAELVDKRRADPQHDIASVLLTGGPNQPPGQPLGQSPGQPPHRPPGLVDADARLVLFGLLISGYVGNRNALARHLFALLAAGQLADLGDQPALAGTAVEELLRCYPSGNDGLLRVVLAPVQLSGVRLLPGDVVMPLVAAAGRDPEVFDRPDELDLRRNPNPHLSLGLGTHGCPGHHLVRALFARTLVQLAQSLPGLRLAVPADRVEHTTDLLPLGLRALPVRW